MTEREIRVCVINSEWHLAYLIGAHERCGKEIGLPADRAETLIIDLPTSFDDGREQIVYEMAVCLSNSR